MSSILKRNPNVIFEYMSDKTMGTSASVINNMVRRDNQTETEEQFKL